MPNNIPGNFTFLLSTKKQIANIVSIINVSYNDVGNTAVASSWQWSPVQPSIFGPELITLFGNVEAHAQSGSQDGHSDVFSMPQQPSPES